MSDAGLWLSRKQRRRFHQPRLRREAYGELLQIDGSEHRWFEDRGPPCSLLVFVDDATGRLMQLRFVRSESAFTYFDALELYLKRRGAPIAIYSDKHSVFRVAKKDAKGGQGMTQFGRARHDAGGGREALRSNESAARNRTSLRQWFCLHREGHEAVCPGGQSDALLHTVASPQSNGMSEAFV